MANDENPEYDPYDFPPQDVLYDSQNTQDSQNQEKTGCGRRAAITAIGGLIGLTATGVIAKLFMNEVDRKEEAKKLHYLAYSLEKGDKGPDVRALQLFLVECDFLKDNDPKKSAVDGKFDIRTEQAVAQFKSMLGTTKSYAKAFCPVQRVKHKKNPHVKSLQKVLDHFGYLKKEKIDGNFDVDTYNAQDLYFADIGVVRVPCK